MEEFHAMQMRFAGALVVVGLLAYTFGPLDRIQLARDVTIVSMAFLFGKFTNGFGRRKQNAQGTSSREVQGVLHHVHGVRPGMGVPDSERTSETAIIVEQQRSAAGN